MKEFLSRLWWLWVIIPLSIVSQFVLSGLGMRNYAILGTLCCLFWFIGVAIIMRFVLIRKPWNVAYAGLFTAFLWVVYVGYASTLTDGQYKPSMTLILCIVAAFKGLTFKPRPVSDIIAPTEKLTGEP